MLPNLQPLREVGQIIQNLGVQIVNIHSGVVVSDNAAPGSTFVALDTSPQDQIPARSICGRLEAGARVVMLAYPPRGLIILGRVDEPDSSLLSPLVYSVSGSFTADDVKGAAALRVRVQAAGGGGAGAPATGVGQNSAGGHGSGGGYAESIIPVSSLTFPVAVTVGAAGAAGAAGGAGGNAAASSFGALVAANGGNAGAPGGPAGFAGAALVNPVLGGSATAGQILSRGGSSGAVIIIIIGSMSQPQSGSSVLGPGLSQFCNVSSNGFAAANPGTGGAGGINMASQAARVGGAGGNALVVVERIYR